MDNELLTAFNTLYDGASLPVILCSDELNVIKLNRFAESSCKQLICDNSLVKNIVSPSRYMAVVKLRENDYLDAVIKSPNGELYIASMNKSDGYQNCVIVTLKPYKSGDDTCVYEVESEEKITPLVCERYKKLLPGIFGYAFALSDLSSENQPAKINKVTIRLINMLHEALRTVVNVSAYYDFNACNAISSDKCLNINRFLNTLFQEITQYFQVMGVKFEFSVTMPDIISYIDPKLFALMIDNIVSNALKFHTPGSKIKAKLVEKDSNYLISVQNKGELLPRSKSTHIFEPFCSYDNNLKNGGIGIGLTVTKHIAENIYGGSCKFSSTSKYGNVLMLKLPIINTSTHMPNMVNEGIGCLYNNNYTSYTEYLKHLIQLFCD